MQNNEISMSENKPKKGFIKRLFRFFLWIFSSLFLLLIASISAVFFYENEVKAIVLTELNKHLNAEVKLAPENIDLTILRTFPDCALEFKNIAIMEATKQKKRDTLLFAELLQLKFDIKDLWNKKYAIKKINIENSFCRLKTNSKNQPNYIVWKKTESSLDDSDSLKFNLELIVLKNVLISYKDYSSKLKTEVLVNKGEFSGMFNETNFDLKSNGSIVINYYVLDEVRYIKNREVIYKTDLIVEGNTYKIKACSIKLNEMLLEAKGTYIHFPVDPQLTLTFEGKNLDIQSILSLLPKDYSSKIADYTSTGQFYAKGRIDYYKTIDINIDFGVANTTVLYIPKDVKVTNFNATGNFKFGKNVTGIELKNVTASLLDDHIKGDISIENFKNPFIQLDVTGDVHLGNILRFWPIDTIAKLRGNVIFNTQIVSNLEDLTSNALSEKSTINLTAAIKNLVFQLKGQNDSTKISTCQITAKNRSVEVANLGITKGKSDLLINGKLEGAFNYLIDKTNPLKIFGDVKSNSIAIEDFLFTTSSVASEKSEITVPNNINFLLDAKINQLSFGKFKAKNIVGNIELKNKKIFADNIKLDAMDGNASIDALFDLTGKNLEVSLHSELTKINVSKLFSELNNFNQQTLKEDNLSGILTATIDFSGSWNKFLEADLNSVSSVADLLIENGRLVAFKPLESLSKFVDINDLKNIRFSNLTSHVQIKNSTIVIPKTELKNSALNILLWGKHSFNNDIDYHIQLLINELLSKKRNNSNSEDFGPVENDPENRRSAFILMTGTVDNPIIKYDRVGLAQKIKDDIKNEKQNLKQILKDEFGLFKKDSIKPNVPKKADQVFKLEDNNPKKKKKKEEDEDEDF